MSPYFILMIQPSIAVILVENQRYHSKNNRNNKYFTVFFIFTFILQHVLAVSSIKPLFCTYFYKILYHKCKKNSSTNYVKNKWRSVDRHLLICSITACRGNYINYPLVGIREIELITRDILDIRI